MASGFEGSVSRIQPKTKKKFFRPKINNTTKPADAENIKQVTQAVLQKEKDEIDATQKSRPVKNKDETSNTGNKVMSGNNIGKLYSIHSNRESDNVGKMKPQGNGTTDSSDLQSDPQLESFNNNRDRFKAFRQNNDREEEKVEKTLPYEKPAVQSRTSSQEVYLHTENNSTGKPIELTGDEPEKETTIKMDDSNTVQDRFKSLKNRLDSFTHLDPDKAPKKNRAQENANTIKSVIKNYQSKIKHLTEELSALEDTYKFTRDELEGVKQDLYKKSLSLEHATKLGREKTALSEDILKEMEITVFERDRAFSTIAELKTVNESNEALLKKASHSLEEKEKELEVAKGREKELLQTIKQRDGEINNLQLALAKRTADRDELFDRLEDLTIQLEEIDKSNKALDEIKGLIDRHGDGLME